MIAVMCKISLWPDTDAEQWRIYIIFGFNRPSGTVWHPPTKLQEGNVFICVCLSTGVPMRPLPMMHWTSFYTPSPLRPSPSLPRPKHETWTPPVPAPLPVTSGGNHWWPVQTCSLEDPPNLYWQLAAWPPKLWNVSACIKSTPCLKILSICKRGW